MPITRFGFSVDRPAARRRCCQLRFSARPPSIAASLDPVVEQPVASAASGACQSRASMFTQRISSSAVCGYSSLSIMFLSRQSAMSCRACGSPHVLTNVARLRRALPSSISSSWTIWNATSGGSSPSGMVWRGILSAIVVNSGGGERWCDGPDGPFGCLSGTERSLLMGRDRCDPVGAGGAIIRAMASECLIRGG